MRECPLEAHSHQKTSRGGQQNGAKLIVNPIEFEEFKETYPVESFHRSQRIHCIQPQSIEVAVPIGVGQDPPIVSLESDVSYDGREKQR
jgi:hypothetical protein